MNFSEKPIICILAQKLQQELNEIKRALGQLRMTEMAQTRKENVLLDAYRLMNKSGGLISTKQASSNNKMSNENLTESRDLLQTNRKNNA